MPKKKGFKGKDQQHNARESYYVSYHLPYTKAAVIRNLLPCPIGTVVSGHSSKKMLLLLLSYYNYIRTLVSYIICSLLRLCIYLYIYINIVRRCVVLLSLFIIIIYTNNKNQHKDKNKNKTKQTNRLSTSCFYGRRLDIISNFVLLVSLHLNSSANIDGSISRLLM